MYGAGFVVHSENQKKIALFFTTEKIPVHIDAMASASDTVTVRLKAEVYERMQAQAKERGLGISIYARDLMHAGLLQDDGEELITLRREVSELREIVIRGFRALLLTLATDTEGHDTADVKVLFQRLLGKE